MATCRGIDVSAYQTPQNWAQHKAEGVVFAFAKASEGQRTHDPRFATHIKGIKSAGLVPGGYHFAWPNQSAVTEADNYISAVRPYAERGFTHWLDLERYSDGRNYAGRTAAQIKAWASAWIATVQTAFPGQRVGVYTSADDIAAGRVPSGVPLWYPAYPWGAATYSKAEAAAQPRPSGRAPIIWQFTSQPMDRSIAYMSAPDFRAWAAGTDSQEDDDMPSTKEIAEAVLKLDGVISIPGAPASNPTWTLSSSVTEILKRLDKANATLTSQSAAIAALVRLVGADVDTAAVVAAVEKAIAEAVVKVSVDVTGDETKEA
ncbi:glycoside hydrolase family 25 protein [Streptomyces sp. NPDC058254]|uniref:glycoside hydrolase family 25 protein n=1 Tax=Streptomyces sp. NPDC058254 TaxID=3346406 RepID=UPI0036E5A79B